MEEKILLEELTNNCESKIEKLSELVTILELAEIGAKLQRERFREIENRVLQENEFFCKDEEIPIRDDNQPRPGDRITSEKWTFLMSREDFERLQQLMLPIYVEEGLTDEKGYYIHNWDSERLEAKNQLVDFLLDEIVPTELRNVFDKERRNIVFMDKLIKIFRSVS